MLRPHYRSTLVRRALLAMLAGLVLLVLLVFVLLVVALRLLPARLELVAVAASAVAALPALLPLLPWAIAALVVLVLAALVLARWAVRPAETLVNAATTLTAEATSPVAARSFHAAAQMGRNFSDLSDQLLRTARELEQQNRTMVESVGRLEQLLAIGHELASITDIEQMLAHAAHLLRSQGGYESTAVVWVEGDELAFYAGQVATSETGVVRVALHNRLLAGRAALTGAPARCDDLRAPGAPAGAPTAPAARSELAVPVIHAGQVLAVLVVQSQRTSAFQVQDEEQLGLLAQMLASALAQSSMFHGEQRRRQMAEVIYRVAQTLGGVLQLERVPELLLDQLGQVLPSDRSALMLVSGGEVITIAARGFGDNAVVARSRTSLAELPLIGAIVAQKTAIALPHAQADARYRPGPGADAAQSWLGTPLLRGDDVTGVLVLESATPDRYGREELAAMAAVAHQAATAFENARLYGEAQERAARLEVITELTKLVSNRDMLRELHSILHTAIHRIRRIVPCDYAALALYNAEDNTFSVEPVYDGASRDWALAASERLPADGTSWQMACRTAGPVLQSNLADSAFERDQQLAAVGLVSSVVVPIRGATREIGALTFASRQSGVYSSVQQNTLMELAHYLGPALYNAMLNREREAATDQLAQTQEYLNLVDKVRVVGQLASGVAHDFNNLLAGILGNAQLLLYEIQDAEQREMLRVIERAAKDGSETVRRLQGFARMDRGSPMTEVRLDMLARDAIDITRPRWRDVAQSRGVSIEIVRELNPVTPIAGRAAELREVLSNLIINAADAMAKSGTITLITQEHDDGEREVMLDIVDTGTGMSPDVQARMFDPFFTTKGEQGTGLGLAVSIGIVKGHGGQIEVESVLGEGTRFRIRLPVRMPAAAVAAAPIGEVPIIAGHLLLIESEPMIRAALVRLLERWGHRVTQATGGIEGLQVFQPDLFDAVLVDQSMPDMSGWDVLAQIKQREIRVPTVLMTGWGHQTSDDEARARGADIVLEKPFDQDILRQALARAMSGEGVIR